MFIHWIINKGMNKGIIEYCGRKIFLLKIHPLRPQYWNLKQYSIQGRLGGVFQKHSQLSVYLYYSFIH